MLNERRVADFCCVTLLLNKMLLVRQHTKCRDVKFARLNSSDWGCYNEQEGKRRTLEIAPLSVGTSLQKRSGMARVVDGFHSFTCTLTRLSTNGVNHTCLCLTSRHWSSLTDPGRVEGWIGLCTTIVSKESAQDPTWRLSQLLAVQTVTPQRPTGASNAWPLALGHERRR